jgi:hypothetical protein
MNFPPESCVLKVQDFFIDFRKCTASIKDTCDRVLSPYCVYNPLSISAALILFHQKFDDTALFCTRSDKV